MEDTIKAFKKKPFRGVTTIQLFDKDTGELVKEVVHENTYNQRLMYFTYFDEILQTGGRFMSANSPSLGSGWIGPAVNYAGIPRCYQNWTMRASMSTSSYNTSYLNLYATLFLTNHTGDASAQGYPDGIPVALAPLAGVSPYAASDTGMGTINIQESYKGNDRIHFVVDFDTSHGNCTFDSLWIYPSIYERGQSGDTTKCADVSPFYTQRHIRTSALLTNIVTSPATYLFHSWEINHPYIVIIAFEPRDNYCAWSYAKTIYVYNSETDTVVAQCTYIETSSGATGGWFPTYYEASTDTLRGWCSASVDSHTASWACPNPTQNVYPCSISMETGMITRDTGASSSISLKINMTLTDLDVTSVTNTFAGLYYLQNAAYLILANICKDENNNTVYRLAIYLANLNTNTFTKVAIQSFARVYLQGEAFLTNSTMRDNLMYIPGVTLSPEVEQTRGVVIDITNGNVLDQRWAVFTPTGYANPYPLFTFATDGIDLSSLFGYRSNSLSAYPYYGRIDYKTTLYKIFNHNKIKHFRYLSLGTGNAQAYEVDYVTAIWSTHNHLDEPITKTNQTTMKIQYDIIWDSITDVIVPAIL